MLNHVHLCDIDARVLRAVARGPMTRGELRTAVRAIDDVLTAAVARLGIYGFAQVVDGRVVATDAGRERAAE